MRTPDGRHRLLRWLRPLLETPTEERVSRIVVRHVSVNDRHTDVAALSIPPGEIAEDTLARLAEEVEVAVQNDADGLGGTQRYLVFQMRDDLQISRLPIRVIAAEESASGEPLDSEPATIKGLLAQLMRHNESANRMFPLWVNNIMLGMSRTIEQQQAFIDAIGDQRLELFAATEGLLSQKHARDLAASEAQQRVNNRELVVQKLLSYLPLIISHWTTKPSGAPGAGSPGKLELLLRSFFDTFTDEQLRGLSSVLSEEQMMAVFAIMEKVKGGGDAPTTSEQAAAASAGGSANGGVS